MAPEQWRGQDLDGRADLYSVGCMAYQMLAGRAPFYFEKGTQSGIYAYMHAHLHASPPPLSEVAPGACPLELEALILSMLAKDRLARPASAQETLGRLSAIRAAGGLADATTGHVAATSSDALPGFAMTEAEANLTARISVGPVAVARGGGRTTPMPSATLPEPQPAPRLTERVPAIAARLPDDAGSTGVPLRDALPPLSPPAPVSGAAVAASVVALLLMATAAGYWLTRENSSSGGAAQSQSPAPDPAASVAGMDPVVPQQPAPEPATAPPTEVGAATAVSAALSVGIASPDPIADAEPPAAAPVAEAPAFAEPAAEATAESGDQESLDAPAAVPDPAPPEPAPPARTVVSVASEPAGAEVRRKGDADVLGTTPFDWTLTDVDLETLTARRPIPLTLSHANGQTGKADLTSVHLDAERPELTAKLTSPKPRPRPAVKGAAVRPAPKAKPKPAATGSFHF
jgi:hypothetical protein